MSDKKKAQLGMNPSTASARLVKDTLWRLIVANGLNQCYRCGEQMTREDFSIEHKIAWLDSADPIGLYFNQDNISFSHLSCNIKDARNGRKIQNFCGTHQSYDRGCRCEDCLEAKAAFRRQRYIPDQRREKYLTKGY